MKALLIGLGGIGKNVYLPQLQRLGYHVETVDNNYPADHSSLDTVKGVFDVAVICTPNFTHGPIAEAIANQCKIVFIEKPGLPSADEWLKLCTSYPNTKFIMCKNNLYRNEYGSVSDFIQSNKKPTKIEISWMNNDRVPNPGNWSTNRLYSWGGVAFDLFPHLYCFLHKIANKDNVSRVTHFSTKQWSLPELMNTDYGNINPQGRYDVCDYAEENWLYGNCPVNIRSSWKIGFDDQSIKVYTQDSCYDWSFGLCPDYAYGNMIDSLLSEDYDEHIEMDIWIHNNLKVYNES